MLTIKEIAKIAGVSPTTVSNVINGNVARVSPQTKSMVEAVLREHNYTTNMAAPMLAHKQSRIVGIIMFMESRRNETVLQDPFTSTILGAIEVELRKHGYYMMIHTTSDEEEVLRLSRAWKLAGLIMIWVPSHTMENLKRFIQTPIVFIDSYSEGDDGGYYTVMLQDKRGGYEIARYILSLGHRRMIFLANDSIIPGTDRERFAGCREAFAEKGLEIEDDRFITLSKFQNERYEVYRCFSDNPRRCTVMVFSADYYAAEAMAFLREIGVRIPEDLSITGFDDNIFSRIVYPPLTTVHQDVYHKGQTAVDMLIKVLRKEHIEDSQVALPVSLQIRGSAAPPAS